MIQRVQTLYLTITAIVASVLPLYLSLWKLESGNGAFFAAQDTVIAIVFYVVAALALLAIFLFKKRQNQFVVNRLNIILNVFLLGFFVYRSLNLSGEIISEKGIGMLIPVFSIVFLVLANKAIKKDEDLVKSVDRLR